jgi:hypothetical protein
MLILATDGHGRTVFFPCNSWQRTDTVIFRVLLMQVLATDGHGCFPCSSVFFRCSSWQRTDTVFSVQFLATDGHGYFPCSSVFFRCSSWQRTDTVIFRAHPCSSDACLRSQSFRRLRAVNTLRAVNMGGYNCRGDCCIISIIYACFFQPHRLGFPAKIFEEQSFFLFYLVVKEIMRIFAELKP